MRFLSSFFALSLLPNVLAFPKKPPRPAPGGKGSAIGPVASLAIANKNIAPDGFDRSTVLAGASDASVAFPGPLIRGNKGDRFALNVINHLADTSMLRSTAIHWHGLFQKGSSWADGPVGVTQCPIVPGDSFLYDFRAERQAGTFWYHSHYLSQYCDGLRGAMVIYDPNDPHRHLYDVDDDSTVLTVGDWYHGPAPSLSAVPTPNSTLINGKGRFLGGPAAELAVISVDRNRRYRFRLVSISCDPNFVFSIDGHVMTIIEVDGINVQPLTVDSIQIFAGQRYSFVLNANRPIGNYWIRSNPNLGNSGFAGGINSAILRYVGAPVADPTTDRTPNSQPLNEASLQPLTDTAAPGEARVGAADVNINLDINFANGLFLINNATFDTPTVPVLLQIMSGARTAQDLMPAGSVYTLPRNKVIELSIPGGSTGQPHPFHLHGHAFSVVRSAGSSTYNYNNPVKRDVVNTGGVGDNVTIRFTTDNPGPWILHCHIDWHMVLGLSVVFAEDVPSIASSDQPPSWDQLCPKFDRFGPEDPTPSS
ncbi:laccase 2 precursor [Coprinellus micaceus]|uniref:Laccase 2 n=1 Tax=Coprinellus micaceus TaxID=71717 RepID=A0A4Y7T5J6_COPMI|nr:laccase 2 precursor [Coprinellus micaceus]